MKENILEAIYAAFSNWVAMEKFCCTAGCACCCTGSVTIIALEGQRILAYCRKNKGENWIARRLATIQPIDSPLQTTNEYVADVLGGRDGAHHLGESEGKCPFLEADRCSIYPVRPFSCRCFFSTTPCRGSGVATVPDAHLYGAMAAMQLIEHLGQFDHWGTMSDVLGVQLDLPENARLKSLLDNPAFLSRCRRQVRRARPLPGFVLPEEQHDRVNPLLQAIFSTRIGDRTIGQILGGR